MRPFHFQLPLTTGEFYFDYHLFYNLTHMADGYLAYQLLYSVGNVILFVPLGIFLPLLFKKTDRFLWIIMIGTLSSLTIEMIQALFTTSRRGTVDDLFFNTVGVLLGFLLFRCTKFIRKRIFYFNTRK